MPRDDWNRAKQTQAAKRAAGEQRRAGLSRVAGLRSIAAGSVVLVRKQQRDRWKPHTMRESVTLKPFAADGGETVYRYRGWWIKLKRSAKG